MHGDPITPANPGPPRAKGATNLALDQDESWQILTCASERLAHCTDLDSPTRHRIQNSGSGLPAWGH
ncbi:hypothetical protein DTO027I6_3024 [Penicillium roqueforti]|uniref:uncharacterized protein n=1 Tax=Penicillium roqueforti TaxID=5082 RepID=UPI00190CE91F|nr:uncharacterized protein LCP9604111_104 [Penicillium roqueforti]KAF9252578.1 hypothetical protein LCP9604111_104 [Penicillium roqueforti]KAI1835643.1 hypothetical protein CBS147337_3666 [Penicillium roqueforti]KAI2675506.1 hypothetical protein CBS147355_6500 [Penicillium roqueforti]KAI2687121.1 hypothetical protein LCP963914a_3722 [Penicillium roqueforti]KAI2698465.1 hypothetical protein CBS147372_6995 [Penicillium roqueforti]